MEIKILILFAMMFCHIVDDYYLQGWLASAKQKKYWKDNAPDELYKNDYKMALFMHSFSWSFMVMLIPTIYKLFFEIEFNVFWDYIFCFVINQCLHFYIDNTKANKKRINLITDQCIHIIQIIMTWLMVIIM